MNRAIMILRDSLEFNETQIDNAKQLINDGCYGQILAECKDVIKNNEEYNKEIECALEQLKENSLLSEEQAKELNEFWGKDELYKDDQPKAKVVSEFNFPTRTAFINGQPFEVILVDEMREQLTKKD